ncbi:MAG TPA: hypothetical protein VFE47_00320 [Tepidisphaeraceae bacterium]|jgi:hypothetical protein|nr:hypothetical protein [Tepidisphaeraceae bacterium]
MLLLIAIFAVIAAFFVIFALKEALFEWRSRRIRPGGFEVKPFTGSSPVLLKEKDNDHG